MNEQELRVRSQLIPLLNLHLILPNTAIAEVIAYHEPQPVEEVPDWVIGLTTWRGLRIPLISFETASINQAVEIHHRNRIIVLNTLRSSDTLPFYAIISQGIPRLMVLDSSTILDAPNVEDEQKFVLRQVLVEGNPAIIPDQNALEQAIAELGLSVTQEQAQAV